MIEPYEMFASSLKLFYYLANGWIEWPAMPSGESFQNN